ncbi:hypothetical protein [Allosphingosinicella vermicomposti]|uniref:hypothetical protein n=1 Tax=Allosphingosinicella vermicomposti TaxID=614671 RepID=UPI00131A5BDF|nr:hypothetical protein [Allosphingosinicella vermicomposti]
MRSISLSAAILCNLLVLSGPALAEKPAKKDPNKMICRANQVDTGTIMSKKVCRTRAEWDAMSKKGEDDVARLRQKTDSYSGSPSNGLN